MDLDNSHAKYPPSSSWRFCAGSCAGGSFVVGRRTYPESEKGLSDWMRERKGDDAEVETGGSSRRDQPMLLSCDLKESAAMTKSCRRCARGQRWRWNGEVG